MIKKRGTFEIRDGRAHIYEFLDSADSLPEGNYKFLIFDEKKNQALPHLKYLFGVVLKTISDGLPNHPPVEALYRYFEEVYAPIHTCEIRGEKFEYFDLKNEKANEVNDVIDSIIHHATSEWGIAIPDRDTVRQQPAQELYEDAYIEMWKNLMPNNNIVHTNERQP